LIILNYGAFRRATRQAGNRNGCDLARSAARNARDLSRRQWIRSKRPGCATSSRTIPRRQRVRATRPRQRKTTEEPAAS